MPHSHRHDRLRVRVRSYHDLDRTLHWVTESEARVMCGENADGSIMFGQDGKPIQPVARRLSKLKHALSDIQLLAPARRGQGFQATLTFADIYHNAMAKAFDVLGGPEISIRTLNRAEAKVHAWPEIHDDRAVMICAGRVCRPTKDNDDQRVSTYSDAQGRS
jgi:hypothetical protein